MTEFEYLTYDSSATWTFPDLADFRHWLEKLEPALLLSRGWDTRGCPTWMFLRSHGWERPLVFPTGRWIPDPSQGEEEEDAVPLAPWAAEFVWWSFRLNPRSMTVGDCLKLLDNPLFKPAAWENGKSRPVLWRTIGI